MNLKTNLLLFFSILLLNPLHSEAKSISYEDLASIEDFKQVKISPDGSKIAAAVKIGNRYGMVTYSSKDFEMLGGMRPGNRYEPKDFFWASNERIVIRLGQRPPWQEDLDYYGELFAMNYDGSKKEMIFGINAGEMQTGSHIKKKKSRRAWAFLIDPLPEDSKHILISSEPMSEDEGRAVSYEKLNVYNGRTKKLGVSPVKGAFFVTDQTGEVRLTVGSNKNAELEAYHRAPGGSNWQRIDSDIVDANFNPLSFDLSGENLYFLGYAGKDKKGLHKLNLKTQTSKAIYVDPDVDITSPLLSIDGRKTFAIRVDPDYPNYLIIDKKNPEADTFKALLSTFPGHRVEFTSTTEDRSKYIVLVSSATDPGTYFLFDKKNNSLKKLFAKHSKINSKQLADVRPIKFNIDQSTTIHGYLTDPFPNQDQSLPMVMLIHGGPHGVRNYWTFDSEAQALARKGYRVLQVNYRGSTGYGYKYMAAGFKQWGGLIQNDINAATQWAIEQNIADKDKICIMGSSFGGYSAVQSATLHPDLYQCVVAVAGVYDLQLMFEEGDIPERYYGKAFLRNVLGEDKQQLKAFSPTENVQKLKAPLLIIHGDKDERAPIEQAEALKKALDKHKIPYEWNVESKAGHGFVFEESREAYFERVTQFISKHI